MEALGKSHIQLGWPCPRYFSHFKWTNVSPTVGIISKALNREEGRQLSRSPIRRPSSRLWVHFRSKWCFFVSYTFFFSFLLYHSQSSLPRASMMWFVFYRQHFVNNHWIFIFVKMSEGFFRGGEMLWLSQLMTNTTVGIFPTLCLCNA